MTTQPYSEYIAQAKALRQRDNDTLRTAAFFARRTGPEHLREPLAALFDSEVHHHVCQMTHVDGVCDWKVDCEQPDPSPAVLKVAQAIVDLEKTRCR